MRSKIVNECIEVLCQRGCREVTAIIRQLENGEPVPGTGHLRRNELRAVRRELESIMAVYEDGCPVDVGAALGERRRRRVWTAVLVVGCVLWFGIMLAASYWGYINRDPVRIPTAEVDARQP